MEQQQHGLRELTPRAGSDRLQKSAKSLLRALQLLSISQISTQKYGSGRSGHYYPLNSKKNSSNRIILQIRRRPENLKLYFKRIK